MASLALEAVFVEQLLLVSLQFECLLLPHNTHIATHLHQGSPHLAIESTMQRDYGQLLGLTNLLSLQTDYSLVAYLEMEHFSKEAMVTYLVECELQEYSI